MGKLAISLVSALVVVIILNVRVASGGECCRSYVDVFGRGHTSQWCHVYCCGSMLNRLHCCTDPRARSQDNTEGWCFTWFRDTNNVWAPILIGIVVLVIIIISIACCVQCCCWVC